MSDTSTPWTEAAKAHLDELLQHRPPLSYDAIADRMVSKFHRIFTKNSCISRARRSKHNKERAATGQHKRKRTHRHPVAVPPKPDVKWGEVTIYQLDSHTCRWPVTDGLPPYLYCGIPPVEGSVYCSKHSRIAYPAMGRH